jgi:hypothetical protein
MNRLGIGLVATVAGATLLLLSGGEAYAQDPSASASVSASATPVSIAPTTTVKDEAPDHDKVVNHFAVGYFGVTNLPIGPGAVGTNFVPTPIIGARYWLMRGIGIDGGIGFSTLSGSTETVTGGTSVTADHNSQLGFALHVGVPLALAAGHHFTFELVPETNLGFTSGTLKNPNPGPDTNLSGFLWQLGARIGGEIQFGFIGIPELALEGSVGLYMQRQVAKSSVDPNSASDGAWSVATTVGSNPWAIFTNNISALYYF